MLQSSLEAVLSLLNSLFPDVGTIYLNSKLNEVQRPSFLVQMLSSNDEHLNRSSYQTRVKWQISHFALLDEAGNENLSNQLKVIDQLRSALMEKMTIYAPDGTCFHILDVEGGRKDDLLYLIPHLESEIIRGSKEYEIIQEIHHKAMEG
jgi:hypothetical protein